MTPVQMRPTRRDEAAEVVELINAYSFTVLGVGEEAVESLLADWQTPGFCMETDSVVVDLPDGRPGAIAELWDLQETHLRMFGYWRVHPDFRDQELEERLAEWIEERARRGVPLAIPGARVTLLHRFIDLDKTAERVLLSRGYRIVRRLVRMTADLKGSEEQGGPGVEGIRLLPLEEAYKEGAIRALYEAFRDHWGTVPESFEQYRRRTLHFFDHPEVSPELSLVAVEGEEVVAAAISSHGTADDARMGWVNQLGVRRLWRKRGVGEALLRRSFAGFRAQGLERAGLNVDAESLTGATRLYQKVGMAVTRCYLTYELELRGGEDLTMREIGEKP